MTSDQPPDPSVEETLASIRKLIGDSPRAPSGRPMDGPAAYCEMPVPEPEAPPKPPTANDPEDLKRLILIHNEKTKLTATATNTTAVALFGGGFVLPVVGLSFPLAAAPPPGQLTLITMVVWALVAAGLHWWARSMLEGLR